MAVGGVAHPAAAHDSASLPILADSRSSTFLGPFPGRQPTDFDAAIRGDADADAAHVHAACS